MNDLLTTSESSVSGIVAVITAMIASFTLAQCIAWIYCRTYRGFSYSRSFVHTLVLGALVSTIMIAGIGNNLARGLGVLGALAIIRFRTQIRDPRDIIFLFAALAIGISCGAGAYAVAVLGCAGFAVAALFLHWSPFASLQTHEGLVRFIAETKDSPDELVERIFEECCSSYQLASVREAVQGDAVEHTYQVRLRDPSYQSLLINRLNAEAGRLRDASFLMHRATVEI